jgi:hypothetical protein
MRAGESREVLAEEEAVVLVFDHFVALAGGHL